MSLEEENRQLKKTVSELQARLKSNHVQAPPRDVFPDNEALSIIVLGASGDLAKKKTYPALFALYRRKLIPAHTNFVGYARSELKEDEFREHLNKSLKAEKQEEKDAFLKRCYYHAGGYDSVAGFKGLSQKCDKLESESISRHTNKKVGNRLFYFAVPPTVFLQAAEAIKEGGFSSDGFNRLVIEKPFGRDLQSSAELSEALAKLFTEDMMYRIDHYLGKEMVQNLMVLRFSNIVFEPLWNRHYINNVQITMKEDFGTEGRGGYFDQFGIIRDVMQNHLIQILAFIGMEHPVSASAEHVRDEKVKLLRCVAPLQLHDLVVGQFVRSEDGIKSGYLEEKGVPQDSTTPTFAAAVLHINNDRWKGVPFILKCGKALNERKAEIRIQFHEPANGLFPSTTNIRNELVLRVQPNEALYLKFNTKDPGLSSNLNQSELDLTYNKRFSLKEGLPEAYERLIYDVVRGDHNLFVRDDELDAAWRIFTPILHQLEKEKTKPHNYPYGSRGPKEADHLLSKYGYKRNENYRWADPKL